MAQGIRKQVVEHLLDAHGVEQQLNRGWRGAWGVDQVDTMCCRLRLDTRKLEARGGGLFGANPLTGSSCVVTLNLPRIGYRAHSEEEFFTLLEENLQIAKNSLEIKRKILERYTLNGLYPYTRFYLKNIYERFMQYWKNHFSTIGIIGMNEACVNYLGKNLGTSEGRAFALKVMDYLRERLVDFQEETECNYNLEATPAEGTSYRLAILDKKFYPDIISANCGGETPFYTNSSQLPVNFSDDIFEVLDLQDELQTKYTGGTVLHIFGGERVEHGESIRKLVRTICSSSVSYTHLRAHETPEHLVCRLLLEKKKNITTKRWIRCNRQQK